MFSVGILYSAADLLEFVDAVPVARDTFPLDFPTFKVADSRAVLDLVQRANWVSLALDGELHLTAAGREILKGTSTVDRLRCQLRDIITIEQPAWASLIPRGREEATRYLGGDIRQCFEEANLLDGYTDEIVGWWDGLATAARGKRADQTLEIGRRGEKLSLAHERHRTGREPTWQSVESNLSGYDILSQVSEDDETPLRIEVKASVGRHTAAEVHITRNEWDVASISGSYQFHLWLLAPEPKLAVVDAQQMAQHIPVDSGKGVWEITRVPFMAFFGGVSTAASGADRPQPLSRSR